MSLFASTEVLGQSKIKEWDKEWDKKVKGKLKLLRSGKKSSGFATFYYKSNKAIFSVEKRDLFQSKSRPDSGVSFSANFINDTLFRVVIWRTEPEEKPGHAIIYLDGNKILDQYIKGKVYIPEISKIIDRAYQLLSQAKALVANK